MWKLGVAVTFIIAVVSGSKPNPCDPGSEYWCQSYETATECGVLAWCKLRWNAQKAEEKAVVKVKDPVEIVSPVKNEILAEPLFKFLKKTEAKQAAADTTPDAAPVEVTLYFESLCPGCKQWLLNTAYPAYLKLASSGILNINLVPYGNAQERPYGGSYTFYCQHGAAECYGNKIETCAIHHMGNQAVWFPFIHCIEYYGPTDTNAQYCASLQKIDYTAIRNCARGAEGTTLEHEMALKTNALNPRHQYVPWLTMNGYHTSAIQDGLSSNMVAYVCAAYMGTKPAACTQLDAADKCFKE